LCALLNKAAPNQTTCFKKKGKGQRKGKYFNDVYGRELMEGLNSRK
jgi:hypothetical protein